jgi:hypothetical protein
MPMFVFEYLAGARFATLILQDDGRLDSPFDLILTLPSTQAFHGTQEMDFPTFTFIAYSLLYIIYIAPLLEVDKESNDTVANKCPMAASFYSVHLVLV